MTSGNLTMQQAGNDNREKADTQILLVDDDPSILRSLEQLLQLHNYRVETALGGQAALKKLDQGQYDLLLLDIKMPDITGHDVLQHIQKQKLAITTIIVSGENSAEDARKALRAGAQDYIKKPYHPEELITTVENAVCRIQLQKNHARMQAKLQSSETLHKFIVNSSPDIIFILDRKGRFSFLNTKVDSLLGYERQELLGKHLTTIVEPESLAKATYFIDQCIANNTVMSTIEIGLKPKQDNRRSLFFEISMQHVSELDAEDIPNGAFRLYGTARDITERLEAEDFINFQAYHDLLTRLPNRTLFKDRLSISITQAKRNNSKIGVFFIDLDRFKIINDSFGHTMGDRLLQEVGKRLQQCIRKGDTLSRFGGDEFTLLLPELRNDNDVTQIAEKILDTVKTPFEISGNKFHIGTSIGIAIYPDSGTQMDQLIKNADIAMYRVKNSGKNGYQLYTPDMDTSSSRRLMLEHDMHSALENDSFDVVYQPQFAIDSNTMIGVEALTRWHHPAMGDISPTEFIPIAEESRLIVEMDKRVMFRACTEIKKYQENLGIEIRLSVNLSPRNFEKDNFSSEIISILEQTEFPPHLLELEITESLLMNDHQGIIDKLRSLSQAGIRIAIDDFGTGYSTLSYLQKFPLNTLKIDRSFIQTLRYDKDKACIVNAIIAMAQGLKLSVVVEGVETKEQLEYLASLDCEIAQGFLFGKPTKLDSLPINCAAKLQAFGG